MDKAQIQACFEKLNDELKSLDVKGEICLYGGAVMTLVFDARPSTKDVDAIFKPRRYQISDRMAASRDAARSFCHS